MRHDRNSAGSYPFRKCLWIWKIACSYNKWSGFHRLTILFFVRVRLANNILNVFLHWITSKVCVRVTSLTTALWTVSPALPPDWHNGAISHTELKMICIWPWHADVSVYPKAPVWLRSLQELLAWHNTALLYCICWAAHISYLTFKPSSSNVAVSSSNLSSYYSERNVVPSN